MDKVLLSRKETAQYVGVCLATLDKMDLPKIKIGQVVCFKKADIDSYLQSKIVRDIMNKSLRNVIDKMIQNLSEVKYGDVSVCFKIHDGRISTVTHSVTNNTREIDK